MIKGLNKILNENLISFHVPGHKGQDFFPDRIKKNIEKIDITEFSGSDNLHYAQGMICKAQERAAQVFGAQQSYFLVNGTTVGIQAMILSVCKPGDKIIVPRNCHRSVWGALILGDITPIYIEPQIHSVTGIALSISPEDIEKKLNQHPEVKAAIITYPTYYGTCCDIEKIGKILHNRDKLLLVDEAHGAHLALHKNLPKTALAAGADITVQSTHKLLSSFTQSSMLHLGKGNASTEMLEMFLGMLQSSSPSYPLMASLDFATQQAQEEGYERWDKILGWNQITRETINRETSMKALGKEMIGQHQVVDFDESKLWIDVSPLGLKGVEVDEILRREYQIQVELSDYHHILAMTGMGTRKMDVEKLTAALLEIQDRYKGQAPLPPIPIKRIQEEVALTPKAAIYAAEEELSLEEALGRISKEFIIPYPPGIPLVLPGEVLTKEIIKGIKEMKGWGAQIIGPQDQDTHTIKVVKERGINHDR